MTKRVDVSSLVSSALSQGAKIAEKLDDEDSSVAPTHATPEELINRYFEIEEPRQRDRIFAQLMRQRNELVDEFLQAMMANDDDEFMRAAAAAELAKRGDTAAIAFLDGELQNPTDHFFFEQAARALGEVHGPAFYETLRDIWQDPQRDPPERREAMVNMESLAPARALQDFVIFTQSITDIGNLPDDRLEIAMAAFARHTFVAAIGPLTQLHQRILATPFEDAEERDELAAFVAEGIDLLRD